MTDKELREKGKNAGVVSMGVTRHADSEELAEAKTRFASTSIQIQDVQNEMKLSQTNYKNKIDNLQNQAAKDLDIVRTGMINLEEDCEKRNYYNENQVRFFSCKTGECVFTRTMDGNDRQKDIDF